ncbi:MAG TPA: helix-turn-helix domain-containing protein [Mycobacterium sp.]
MSSKRRRSFTTEFKLAALARMAETENITALAEDLGLERKLLYCWRDAYQSGGSARLRPSGRPRLSAVGVPPSEEPAPDAAQRIAALERTIGQQQLDLDFFRSALRHVRERRRQIGAPGAKASTR